MPMILLPKIILWFLYDALCTASNFTHKKNGGKLPITSFIKVINDQIIRPPYEFRNFRALELRNGLKAMLIQDQFSQESAASAIVDVGSMNDPPDQQGLAHLCEHMLFLGTEKFPLENSFNSFVKTNGGQWNGATKLDRTEFFFTIYSSNFMDALDRFSEFFIAPIFTEKALDHEISAMDKEFVIESRTLAHPVESILHQLASPNHNYTKFLSGNRRSLTEKLSNDEILEMRKTKKKLKNRPTTNGTSPEIFRKLRQNLAKFFADFYSPNRMSLVIVHNESLDFMTGKIVELFGGMKKSNFYAAKYDANPFTVHNLGTVAKIFSPFLTGHYMRLIFPIPTYNLSLENSGLVPYVSRLFGDQRPGGLFHKLKRDGFIHFLTIRLQKLARSFAFFNLEMLLTSSGIERWRQLLRIFFQFTGFAVGKGVQELFYDDMKFVESLDYRFKTIASSLSTATLTNELLYERNVSFQEPIYLFPRLPKMIDREKFRNFYSDLLQPDNCIITLISPEFKNETNRVEIWFNTKYRLSKLSVNFSLLLQNDRNSGDQFHQFRTFPSNDLIPTRFNLLPLEDGKLSSKPVLIVDNDHLTAWYKQELRYSQPRTVIYAKISSGDQFSDPQLAIAADIFARSVNHRWKVNSFEYDVKIARYTLGITCPQSIGLIFFAYGFSHKIPIFLERSINAVLNSSDILQSDFQSAKTRTLPTMEQNMESSIKNLDYYSEYLTTKNIWSREDRLAAGESYCSPFFQEAAKINQMIFDIWNPPINQSKSSRKKRKNVKNFIRPILLPEGGEFVFRHNASNISDDSYVRILYQNADDSNLTDVVLNDFLCFLLEKECYDQLRAKDRLGSALECISWSHFGVHGLQITVVGRKAPDYLDERIDHFVNRSQLFLKALPNFNGMKELRISNLRQTPDGEVTLADNFWLEIVNGRYDFDRNRKEIDMLRRLTKENLMNFHQTKLSLKSSKRRKLSIHIAGGDVVALQKSELKNRPAKRKVTEIRDMKSWKDKLKPFDSPDHEFGT